MSYESASLFGSIESAHEFVSLFAEAISESKRELQADIGRASAAEFPRRLDALRLALFNLEKLELCVNRSRRILNDLRSIRRLLFEERTMPAPVVQPKSVRKTPAPPPAFPTTLSPIVARRPPKPGIPAAA